MHVPSAEASFLVSSQGKRSDELKRCWLAGSVTCTARDPHSSDLSPPPLLPPPPPHTVPARICHCAAHLGTCSYHVPSHVRTTSVGTHLKNLYKCRVKTVAHSLLACAYRCRVKTVAHSLLACAYRCRVKTVAHSLLACAYRCRVKTDCVSTQAEAPPCWASGRSWQ